MHSYIIFDNKKYWYKFSDSPYAFDEDIEYTIELYCSKTKIEESNLEDLLFSIHSHVCELRNNGVDELTLKKYYLNQYGYGPMYEDKELYFLLGGDYVFDSKDENYLFFLSEDKKSTLGIYKQEMDVFIKDESIKIKKGFVLNFEGTDVFVNEDKLSTITNLLINDINRLNNLFLEMKMAEKCISIF
jgi:hypothetical protein